MTDQGVLHNRDAGLHNTSTTGTGANYGSSTGMGSGYGPTAGTGAGTGLGQHTGGGGLTSADVARQEVFGNVSEGGIEGTSARGTGTGPRAGTLDPGY